MSTSASPGGTPRRPDTDQTWGGQEPDPDQNQHHGPSGDRDGVIRRDVVNAEREQFGGVKIGSAFFGWLIATGTAVLLTALVAAAGSAVGLATGTDVGQAADQATSDPTTVGLVGGIILLVVLFVAYYCGGYVAGRMARFNGAKQGIAVWVWALLIAVAVAVVGTVAGSKYNVLANLNSFPRIPVGEGALSTAGIIAAVGVAFTSLVGAIVGGLAGMRVHRKVDKAGLGDRPTPPAAGLRHGGVAPAPERRGVPASSKQNPIEAAKEINAMQIDKQQIIDILKNRGDHDKADQAQSDLPDQVDTDQHSEKLSKLGVDPQDLLGGAGSVGDKLGL